MARLGIGEAGGANVLAFLDTIAESEIGAPLLAVSDDGYDVLVGSTAERPHLFHSYADHPQVFVKLSDTLTSSAAGRYQFLARTFDNLARDMRLENFEPENQDRGAIELVRECGALSLIKCGRVEDAIERCAHIWASFPGNSYGQPQRKMKELVATFHAAQAKYAGA
jgi:muramidase (phage lysozyme)